MAPVVPNPFQASHVACETLVWNENNTRSCSTQILDSKKAAVEWDLEGAVQSPPAPKGQSHVGICTVGEPARSLVRAAGFWKLPWRPHISISMGVFGVSFSLSPPPPTRDLEKQSRALGGGAMQDLISSQQDHPLLPPVPARVLSGSLTQLQS